MKRKMPPTDLKILETIYDDYFDAYSSFAQDKSSRGTKNYVPIDIKTIAKKLKAEPDIIFGRLHYNLNTKYTIRDGFDGSRTPFFCAFEPGIDRHSVQFPMLAAALASLREERNKYLTAITFSTISFVVSIFSLLIAAAKL